MWGRVLAFSECCPEKGDVSVALVCYPGGVEEVVYFKCRRALPVRGSWGDWRVIPKWGSLLEQGRGCFFASGAHVRHPLWLLSATHLG